MPKIRYKNDPEDVRIVNQLNTHALAEVLTGDDSAFFSELEVFLERKQEWKCLSQAFKDRDIITDNYNTVFAEPRNQAEKVQGYFD